VKSSAHLHFVTHGDSTRNAASLPLLLLHGFLGSSSDWNDVITETFADCYAIAVDLPGHGQTVAESDESFRMEQCTTDIVALLDELSIDRCHIVAYSMGGRLSLFLCTMYPRRFGRVVITSGSPGLKSQEERCSRQAHDERLAQRLESESLSTFLKQWYRQPLFSHLCPTDDDLKRMVDTRMQNNPVGLARSLRMMGTGAQPSLWDELHSITLPVCLIVGELDIKFVKIATEMTSLLPTVEMSVVKECGHAVHMEKPQAFKRELRRFLDL